MKILWGLALIPLVACSTTTTIGFGDEDGGAGNGADGGTSGEGGANGEDGGGVDPAANAQLATGITVTDVAFYQAVKVTVVSGGKTATKNAPVIAGRPAIVRVFVTPGASFTSHSITGVLTLTTGGAAKTYTAKLTPSAASTDAAMSSTFNFTVDASAIGTDTTFLVQLKDLTATSQGDSSAQYPTSGTATALGATATGTVKINVYPIQFSSGGSTAATGSTDIAAYQKIVDSMYPAANVTLTVESPLTYTGSVPSANGTGWSNLLNFMLQKRAADSTPDVYYYGAFAPAASIDQYCGGGCVAGLSSIPNDASDSMSKASIGLVFGGSADNQQTTGITMTHEVGHTHGRSHAPTSQSINGCATPSGIDSSYPSSYANGDIGVWGIDPVTATTYDPTSNYDVMGYCQTTWISDYTYAALADWIAQDNGASILNESAHTYRMIVDNGDGTISIGNAFPVYGLVSGTPHTLLYQTANGPESVTGYYTPYDHVPGGFMLAPDHVFTSVRVPDLGVKAIARVSP